MAMDEAWRARLLAYCGVTDPEEADLLTLEEEFGSAVAYLANAGVAMPKEGTPRFAQYAKAVKALVLDGYDVRGAQVEGGTLEENPAFRRLVNQLKLTEPAAVGAGGEGAAT